MDKGFSDISLEKILKWYCHTRLVEVSNVMSFCQFLIKLNTRCGPAITFLGIHCKKWELMFLKNLYMNIYRSFIHNHPKLERTQMSFFGWMDKQTVSIHTVKYYWPIKTIWTCRKISLLCGFACDMVYYDSFALFSVALHPLSSVMSLTTEITFSTPELTDILKGFLY